MESTSRTSVRQPSLTAVAMVAVAAILWTGSPDAQEKSLHLNPVIAKLSEGKPVFGLITSDLSLTNARETARAPVDFVYADLEHNPLDFPALNMFLLGMTDRAAIVRKGNLRSPTSPCSPAFPPKRINRSGWSSRRWTSGSWA